MTKRKARPGNTEIIFVDEGKGSAVSKQNIVHKWLRPNDYETGHFKWKPTSKAERIELLKQKTGSSEDTVNTLSDSYGKDMGLVEKERYELIDIIERYEQMIACKDKYIEQLRNEVDCKKQQNEAEMKYFQGVISTINAENIGQRLTNVKLRTAVAERDQVIKELSDEHKKLQAEHEDLLRSIDSIVNSVETTGMTTNDCLPEDINKIPVSLVANTDLYTQTSYSDSHPKHSVDNVPTFTDQQEPTSHEQDGTVNAAGLSYILNP